MKTLEPNAFYWARRRDGGSLTVIETWRDGKALNLMGNLNCPNVEEAEEYFEILGKIEPPPHVPSIVINPDEPPGLIIYPVRQRPS